MTLAPWRRHFAWRPVPITHDPSGALLPPLQRRQPRWVWGRWVERRASGTFYAPARAVYRLPPATPRSRRLALPRGFLVLRPVSELRPSERLGHHPQLRLGPWVLLWHRRLRPCPTQ